MKTADKFFIGGQWVEPDLARRFDVVNPATEDVVGHVALGNATDLDKAVEAAHQAFDSWSRTSRETRAALLRKAADIFKGRWHEVSAAITEEMGAPATFAHQVHAGVGMVHLKTASKIVMDYPFSKRRGKTLIVQEPIGVCGMITPWNWPINQIAAKVAPCLGAGCTMVVKPSEFSPFSAKIWTEILEEAGFPAGVFNMVYGDGPGVGQAMSGHPGIDMISFTGSTAAGIDVAQRAAQTVKRVSQELGGKSPNIILDDGSFELGVTEGVRSVMSNAGQSCNAPTRMLLPASRYEEGVEIAVRAARALRIGDPADPETELGPVASIQQWDKVQRLIQTGLDEGATLAAGGPGRPDGFSRGFYARPTVFSDVDNAMTIAQTEIFGPVLCVIPYRDVDDAIRIANDTRYGIAAYVSGDDEDMVEAIGSRLRAAQVNLNRAGPDPMAPFGGYKQSGNGREWGDHGFHEYLEIKAILGARQPEPEIA
ncbi:aldehyde dehydrogenase family protein [Henriciella aquimarina]|uniref:aldehyde dehydrogenase family protein n=1 Tax=Henriciella aquimarina TaxID=545261 RepID=UPI0009FBFE8D|nr:aldehyde dehydrogenase family protein [Henriciella aquimarina]